MTKVKYSKELLEESVKDCYSIAELCRRIGLKPVGSNYETVKKKLSEFEVDYSHFKGQTWNKGLKGDERNALIPLSDILNKNTNYKSFSLKTRLIKAGLKEDKCEVCGLEGGDVVLELHHINGDHYDNRLENLQVLCPNCHSKTDNFRGRNSKRSEEAPHLYVKKDKPICICLNCGKEFISDRYDRERKFCSIECYRNYGAKNSLQNSQLNITEVLTKENILKVLDDYKDVTNLGKHFGVSSTTMRKYLKKYELFDDFRLKYDFNAKKVRQFDLEGNAIKDWPSIADAEETLNIKSISRAANNEKRSAGGYIWRYID